MADYLKYLVARGAGNRPLVQHVRTRRVASRTLCGRRVDRNIWRIDYTQHGIDLLLCRICKRLDEEGYE